LRDLAYLRDVKRIPCRICVRTGFMRDGETNDAVCDAHHPRTGVGAQRKAPDSEAISLCPGHHRDGVHALHVMGRKAFERHWGVTEAELSAETREAVNRLRARRV
jgi:hypothetical protein